MNKLEPGCHFAIDIKANGKIFVEENSFGVLGWERIDIKDADPEKIIRCCQCSEPAIQIDHYWPYYSERCLCEKHYQESMKGGK